MRQKNEKKNTQELKQDAETLELDADQMEKVSGGQQQEVPELWTTKEEK